MFDKQYALLVTRNILDLQDQENRIAVLIIASIRGEINDMQQEELSNWLNKSDGNRLQFEKLTNEAEFAERLKQYRSGSIDPIWEKTQHLIRNQQPVKKTVAISHLNIFNWKGVVGMAAAIIVLVLGTWLYYQRDIKPTLSGQVVHVIKPGKNGATLTLANGKSIRLSQLSNGEVAKEAGMVIYKTADGELTYHFKKMTETEPSVQHTLSTAKGETYMAILPDQSKVWLNAATSLTYSTGLSDGGVRKVKLDGEAYFEVFKDQRHPFIVETNQQTVKVLGTHFNINSYEENEIKTTLLEGAVIIDNFSLKKSYKLSPGQQAVTAFNQVRINDKIDLEEVMSWKNGEFSYTEAPLGNIMQEIGRWYSVDVEFKDIHKKEILVGFYLSRNSSITKVLKVLESTGLARFTIAKNKIIVQ